MLEMDTFADFLACELWFHLLNEMGRTGIALVDTFEGFTNDDGYSALVIGMGTKSHGFGLEVEIEMNYRHIVAEFYQWEVKR